MVVQPFVEDRKLSDGVKKEMHLQRRELRGSAAEKREFNGGLNPVAGGGGRGSWLSGSGKSLQRAPGDR